MNNGIIKISLPYKEIIEDSPVFGVAARLGATITIQYSDGKIEKRTAYFDYEIDFEEYLCINRSDAFVVGLLSSAMEKGLDIAYEAPISERLFFQLTEYYIPMIAKFNKDYPMSQIKLLGSHDNTPIASMGGVATGCSGGVDSFYTIKKYTSASVDKEYRLTHLVYSSSGTLDNDPERIRNTYKKNYALVQNIAKECNLSLIACFNNLHEFYSFPYRAFSMFFTTTYVSVAFAIQSLLSVYYASSGDPITYFSIDISKAKGHDASVFDVFTVSSLNTENMSVFCSGADMTRIEKEYFISDYLPARKYLTVCGRDYQDIDKHDWLYNNCGACPKCLRTLSHLYALGVIDNFDESFDIKRFKSKLGKNLGKMLATNKVSYTQDFWTVIRKNNKRIPPSTFFYLCVVYKPVEVIKKLLRRSRFIRKIYYRWKLDYLINGYRSSEYDYYNGIKKKSIDVVNDEKE